MGCLIGKISKSKLCCNIEDGGAKLIDIKQYFLALKFKRIGKLKQLISIKTSWKIIEKICLPDILFLCVLCSNCKPNNMIVNNLTLLRFSERALKALKVILDASHEIERCGGHLCQADILFPSLFVFSFCLISIIAFVCIATAESQQTTL